MPNTWWVNDGGYGILPGNATVGGGGTPSAAGAVQFRSPIDAARAVGGRLPQAEYPSGYLGNIIDRRTDRLVQAVTERLTSRSYQRGVHKGSNISPKDYFWPEDDPKPDDGLRRQAKSVKVGNVLMAPRFAPKGNPVEILAHQGRTAGMSTPGDLGNQLATMRSMGISPAQNPIIPQDPDALRSMMPRYRSPGVK
jgi:hypothetical protein